MWTLLDGQLCYIDTMEREGNQGNTWRPSPFHARAGRSAGAGAFLLSPRSVRSTREDVARHHRPGHLRMGTPATTRRPTPLFGSFRGEKTTRGTEGPAFFSKKIPENGLLRYALTKRTGAAEAVHPLKGVKGKNQKRTRSKNEIPTRRKAKPAGLSGRL